MILTGKAKEDFENQICNILRYKHKENITNEKRAVDWINETNNLIKSAHIIEWLDSVKIFIEILKNDDLFIFNIKFKSIMFDDNFYKTRQQATEEAIKKANEIYNNL